MIIENRKLGGKKERYRVWKRKITRKKEKLERKTREKRDGIYDNER